MARKYQKRRRTELEEKTRQRIVEALVSLHGTIGHSLSFSTWQSLTQHNGLSTGKAVMLMTAMVERAESNRSS